MTRRSTVALGMLWLVVLGSGCVAEDPPRVADMNGNNRHGSPWDGPVPEGAWSVVVLPDTQYLTESYPEVFESQTRWIREQREALQIVFVAHVGDIVEHNDTTEWDVAHRALTELDGHVPYVLAPGNHDYGLGGSAVDRDTLLDTYFPVTKLELEPSFGGTFEPGRVDNSYHVFDTPEGPFLVLALEFGPRDQVIEWAAEVLEHHAPLDEIGMSAMIVTHAYLYSDDTRYDRGRTDQRWSPYEYGLVARPGGVNDGEEMFEAFIRRHDAIDLVVCGHVLNDGLGRLTSEQDGGSRVHQVLANYQQEPLGGAGFLRVMTFSPDGTRIDVRTYSPYLDEHRDDPDNSFSLER